jgi:hypothetical protein
VRNLRRVYTDNICMTITAWAHRTSLEATRRRELTPLRTAHDDDGHPAEARVERWLRKLPGETHKEAAARHFDNARNDLWEVGHLDVTAEMIKGVEGTEGKATRALGYGLGGFLGVVGDLMQGAGRLLTAGAHGLAGVFSSIRG